MKRLSVFAMALLLTLFVACGGEKSDNEGMEHESGEEMVDNGASEELNNVDSADGEPTLEEEVFGVGVDD